jgi:outer membrane receptor for monomeric catechols
MVLAEKAGKTELSLKIHIHQKRLNVTAALFDFTTGG